MDFFDEYADEAIETLVGDVVNAVDRTDEEICFVMASGRRIRLYHVQDCCETVIIFDVDGDLQALVGNVVQEASKETSNDHPPDVDPEELSSDDSYTWSTFRIRAGDQCTATRWFGTSNGYYGEDVKVSLEDCDEAFSVQDLIPDSFGLTVPLSAEQLMVCADYWEEHGNDKKSVAARSIAEAQT